MAEEITTPKETTAPGLKPGYKTTEFWLSVSACALGAFAASGAFPDEHIAMKIAGMALAALAAMGYTTSRLFVKKSANESS